jgi:hypothetical protein
MSKNTYLKITIDIYFGRVGRPLKKCVRVCLETKVRSFLVKLEKEVHIGSTSQSSGFADIRCLEL